MFGKTILAVSFIAGTIALANYSETYLNTSDTSSNQTITQLPNKAQNYRGIVKTVDDIAEQITVRIATPDIPSFGSGAIIARNGNTYYVATARHVVQDRKQYQIVTPDGATYELDNNTIVKLSQVVTNPTRLQNAA